MIRGRLLIAGLTLLPKGLLSRLTGRLVALPLPQFLRRGIIGAFARAFGADPTQAERDLAEYRSIADFFIRRLKSGARVVDASPNALVSPADGRLLLAGVIEAGSALQIKGKPYRVEELLAGGEEFSRFDRGTFATVYLSPKDYHRVHSPVAGRLTGYVWIPGALWPVNEAGVTYVDRLFCRNERVAMLIETDDHGLVAVVMVGATNVGCMTLTHAPDVRTNTFQRKIRRVQYEEPVTIERGGELGIFHMGSTVVLLTERGDLECAVDTHAPLQMGQLLLAGPEVP